MTKISKPVSKETFVEPSKVIDKFKGYKVRFVYSLLYFIVSVHVHAHIRVMHTYGHKYLHIYVCTS